MKQNDEDRGWNTWWEGVEDGGRDTTSVDKVQVRGKEEVEGLDLGPGSTCDSTLLRAVRHDRRWHDCTKR
jgi:hypothetical protein